VILFIQRKEVKNMDPEQQLITTAAVVEVTKEIAPEVYKDGLQPAVKQLGKDLHTVSKLVTIALTPISALVWSYDKIIERFLPVLEKKLENVPIENIVTPDPSIAVPVIEALRYTGHNDELREMFSNLLVGSMDRTTSPLTHPSFVEIIKQINSDEAKIIKLLDGSGPSSLLKVRLYNPNSAENSFAEPLVNFSYLPFAAGCAYPELGPSYIENLERLALINISYDIYNTNPNAYDILEKHNFVKQWEEHAPKIGHRFEINRGVLTVTSFGQKFYETCIISK
jgi:hypothetical protein